MPLALMAERTSPLDPDEHGGGGGHGSDHEAPDERRQHHERARCNRARTNRTIGILTNTSTPFAMCLQLVLFDLGVRLAGGKVTRLCLWVGAGAKWANTSEHQCGKLSCLNFSAQDDKNVRPFLLRTSVLFRDSIAALAVLTRLCLCLGRAARVAVLGLR